MPRSPAEILGVLAPLELTQEKQDALVRQLVKITGEETFRKFVGLVYVPPVASAAEVRDAIKDKVLCNLLLASGAAVDQDGAEVELKDLIEKHRADSAGLNRVVDQLRHQLLVIKAAGGTQPVGGLLNNLACAYAWLFDFDEALAALKQAKSAMLEADKNMVTTNETYIGIARTRWKLLS